MTFIELVENVALKTGMPKTKVKEVLRTAATTIDTHVLDFGGEVKWINFGRFRSGKTKAGKAFGHTLTPRPALKFHSYGR